jgi:uridine kinase
MFIIGIAGGTGSGKSTLVGKVVEDLPCEQVALITQDCYYNDCSHIPPELRQEINFDHPSSVEFTLLEKHILKLKNGEAINQPVYSYLTCTRSQESIRIEPKKVVILEGILIFTYQPLRNLMDLKIFVDADADDRLSRIIYRDITERGRTTEKVLERYEKTVKPMHLQFIEPARQYADIIVPKGGNNMVAINVIKTIIGQKIQVDVKHET